MPAFDLDRASMVLHLQVGNRHAGRVAELGVCHESHIVIHHLEADFASLDEGIQLEATSRQTCRLPRNPPSWMQTIFSGFRMYGLGFNFQGWGFLAEGGPKPRTPYKSTWGFTILGVPLLTWSGQRLREYKVP